MSKQTQTVIEVKHWGDFDIQQTKCIMVSEYNVDVKCLTDEYCALRKLPGTDGLTTKQLNNRTDDFITYLQRNGFRKLKTKEVCFSD